MIRCPRCSAPSEVIETRGARRRRQCSEESCGVRFATHEVIRTSPVFAEDSVLVSRRSLTAMREACAAVLDETAPWWDPPAKHDAEADGEQHTEFPGAGHDRP